MTQKQLSTFYQQSDKEEIASSFLYSKFDRSETYLVNVKKKVAKFKYGFSEDSAQSFINETPGLCKISKPAIHPMSSTYCVCKKSKREPKQKRDPSSWLNHLK